MNLKELSSPIRIYWDISPSSSLPIADYRRIAEEIASGKILSLQITETAQSLSPSCLTILDTLREQSVALSLVAPITALDAHALDILRRYPVKVVFAQTASIDDLGMIAEIAANFAGKPAVGVSFIVARHNFRELPRVLDFCRERNITHLLLPMQRLTLTEDCFTFSKAERQELAAQLHNIEKPAALKITIHDPFLWRAFYPAVEFPNGGCQAANTMLYISPEADVYPCPTLPVKIGSLTGSSLREVMRSEQKREFRKRLLSAMAGCSACAELGRCRGGCRGRAYMLTRSLEGLDPACK